MEYCPVERVNGDLYARAAGEGLLWCLAMRGEAGVEG